VDTTRNVQGGTIEGATASEIPVNGRDFTKLLTMVPGATADASGIYDSPGSFGLFSINGNRGRSNNYLLDGTDMNDGYRNLPAINEGACSARPPRCCRSTRWQSSLSSPARKPSTAQRRRHRQHRHQVRHEQVDGQRLRVLPRRLPGLAQLLQQAADAEERLPQQPVRRLSFGGPIARTARSSSRLRRAARTRRVARPCARARRKRS
jgi:hypothetical protein